MSLDTSASSLRRLAEQRLESLRGSASTFTTPLQKTSHMEMRTFLTNFYETIWTAEKRKFYDCEMQQYPSLKGLYQELVMHQKKLAYEDFWQRYEYRCDMSRVIHGILQRDDPDLMKTVMDRPSQTVTRNTTLCQSSSSKVLQDSGLNALSTDPTTSNRTNLNHHSQFTERLIQETIGCESEMNHNDPANTGVVKVGHSPQLCDATTEDKFTEKGVEGTNLEESSLPIAEASPSPSACDEKNGKGNDEIDNRTDLSIAPCIDPKAIDVFDKLNCNEQATTALDNNLVSSIDMMGNGSLANKRDEKSPSTHCKDMQLPSDCTCAGVVKMSHDSDARLDNVSLLLLEDDEVDVTSSSSSIDEWHDYRSAKETTLTTKIDKVQKNSKSVTVAFLMKSALVISFLIASIAGMAAVVVVLYGVVPFDTLCTPIRPGLDVTLQEMGNSTKFSAPWWAPEEWKETCFSVLCANEGFVRTEIQVDWNAKKRFLGVSIIDLDTDKALLRLKQLRSFQLLPETLQLRAETTRGRVTIHPAPWGKSNSRNVQ